MSLTTARRKKLQRERDRAAGWAEISVKVPAERIDEVRDFVASLPAPTPPRDPRQLDIIERIEAELAGVAGDTSPGQTDLFG